MAISVASSFFNAADSENEILKRSAEARPDAKNATISTYMLSLDHAFRHAVNSWSPTRATHVSPQKFVVPRPRLATNSPTSSFDVTSHTPVRTRQNQVHVLVGRARSLTREISGLHRDAHTALSRERWEAVRRFDLQSQSGTKARGTRPGDIVFRPSRRGGRPVVAGPRRFLPPSSPRIVAVGHTAARRRSAPQGRRIR